MNIHSSVIATGSQNDVYILARIDPIKQKYRLVKVNPVVGIVDFDIYQELMSKPKQKVMKLRKGTDNDLIIADERIIPFG